MQLGPRRRQVWQVTKQGLKIRRRRVVDLLVSRKPPVSAREAREKRERRRRRRRRRRRECPGLGSTNQTPPHVTTHQHLPPSPPRSSSCSSAAYNTPPPRPRQPHPRPPRPPRPPRGNSGCQFSHAVLPRSSRVKPPRTPRIKYTVSIPPQSPTRTHPMPSDGPFEFSRVIKHPRTAQSDPWVRHETVRCVL